MIPDCQRWREPEPPLRVEVVRPHSEADVLTVAETAKRLRIRRADCQAWLERLGLLVDVAGSPRVVWGSVIRALQALQRLRRCLRGADMSRDCQRMSLTDDSCCALTAIG